MRIFADTNVLFPFSVMDLLLALTENEVHKLVWSDFLLDEWERVIVRESQRTPESAAKVAAVVRAFFGDSRIPEDAYAHLVDEAPSSDPDDRHHIAAALAAGADVIVTNNLDDFPSEPLALLGLRVLTMNEYPRSCALVARPMLGPGEGCRAHGSSSLSETARDQVGELRRDLADPGHQIHRCHWKLYWSCADLRFRDLRRSPTGDRLRSRTDRC